MHRLVAQDVLVLLGGAGHLVLAAEGEDLHEADVEEQAFHDAGKHDQRLQQLLVGFQRAGLEGRVAQRVDKRDQELVLVADRGDLVVGVEDFAFVQAEAFDDVLVGVGVDGLVEGLAQQELAAFRRRDLAVGAEHDIVGSQAVGGDEEAEVALDDAHFVFAQLAGLPLLDVALHVHFLRHPVVCALGQVLLPCPLVFERHQLVHVGLAVDDALVDRVDAVRHGGGSRIGRYGRRGDVVVFKCQHVGSCRVRRLLGKGGEQPHVDRREVLHVPDAADMAEVARAAVAQQQFRPVRQIEPDLAEIDGATGGHGKRRAHRHPDDLPRTPAGDLLRVVADGLDKAVVARRQRQQGQLAFDRRRAGFAEHRVGQQAGVDVATPARRAVRHVDRLDRARIRLESQRGHRHDGVAVAGRRLQAAVQLFGNRGAAGQGQAADQ